MVPELLRPKIAILRPSPTKCAAALPTNERPTFCGPDPSRRHTRGLGPESASHSPSGLNARLETPSVAALAGDKSQWSFPELSERESPDLLRVGALERRDGVGEGEGRVGLVLDLPQREELLCLGAQRLLQGPLL